MCRRLQLLARGLLAAEVRAELGISQSTLDAHLASARRKLDARTTLQAVLRFCQQDNAPPDPLAGAGSVPDSPEDPTDGQTRLLDTLAGCRTFNEAWAALRAFFAEFDVAGVDFGIVSDLAGVMDGSGVAYWSCAAEEMTGIYKSNEVAKTDPVALHIATSNKPHLWDGEGAYKWLQTEFGVLPGLVEYYLDRGWSERSAYRAATP